MKNNFIDSTITKKWLQRIIDPEDIGLYKEKGAFYVLQTVFPVYKNIVNHVLNRLLPEFPEHGHVVQQNLVIDRIIELCIAYPFAASSEVFAGIFKLIERQKEHYSQLPQDGSNYTGFVNTVLESILRPIEQALIHKIKELYGIDLFAHYKTDTFWNL